MSDVVAPEWVIVVGRDSMVMEVVAQEIARMANVAIWQWPELAQGAPAHPASQVAALRKMLGHARPLVMATHSEAVVSAVGEFVEEQRVRAYVVRLDGGERHLHRYDGDGCLTDGWPVGFFAP